MTSQNPTRKSLPAFVNPKEPFNINANVHYYPTLGCDPEFFFERNGKVIGAEKVLPQNGLHAGNSGKIIIDGVQAELNPGYHTCRAHLSNDIQTQFRHLKALMGKDLKITVARNIQIDPTELATLNKENQRFGCAPSNNADGGPSIKLDKVDATKFMNRGAGGHIHIGTMEDKEVNTIYNGRNPKFLAAKMTKEDPQAIVDVLDMVLGNTLVLIDRDPGNKIRRRLYGRAGEYRLPKHGLEYRTPSNFWLVSHNMMSLAMGLARLAVGIATHQDHNPVWRQALYDAVNMKAVRLAINSNNLKLAQKNFNAIRPILEDITAHTTSDYCGLVKNTMEDFLYFAKTVQEKGLFHWFKNDPMTTWTTMPEGHTQGAGWFLAGPVRTERTKSVDERTKQFPVIW